MYEARRQRSSWARIKLSIVFNKVFRILAGIDVRLVAYLIFKNLTDHSRVTYLLNLCFANFIRKQENKNKYYLFINWGSEKSRKRRGENFSIFFFMYKFNNSSFLIFVSLNDLYALAMKILDPIKIGGAKNFEEEEAV